MDRFKKPTATPANPKPADNGEEDDYMTMTFTEAPTAPETSLQRRQRLKRQGEISGRIKSKAELAAEAEQRREEALSRSLIDEARSGKVKSKGLAMMAKMGFTGGALGKKDSEGKGGEKEGKAEVEEKEKEEEKKRSERDESGKLVEPLRIQIRDGREGIGLEGERKRKLREAAEQVGEVIKKAKVNEVEYRDRVRREREELRAEKMVYAAQKTSERLDDAEAEGCGEPTGLGKYPRPGDEDEDDKHDRGKPEPPKKDGTGISSRPLKSIPLVYRSLIRNREISQRDRRMRHDLQYGLANAQLPTYDDADEDADDRLALGKDTDTYVTADDLDESDAELEEFEALEATEKLRRLVLYLREKHKYCFWCRYKYADEEALKEGCPGLEEEDHD